MLTIVLIVIGLGLFGLGVVAPRISKRWQHKVDHTLTPLERKADRLLPWLRWLARSPFWTSKKVTDVTSKQGRRAGRKLRD